MNSSLESSTEPVSVAPSTPPEPVSAFISKKGVYIFHTTVATLFLLLLVSPIVTTIQDDGTALATLAGMEPVFTASYNMDDIMFILVFGAMGLAYLCLSWYWFLGYFFLSHSLQKSKELAGGKLAALIVFFALCTMGAFMVFEAGTPLLWLVPRNGYFVVGHLSGYYIYILLVLYLISCAVIFSPHTGKDVKMKALKISSAAAVLSSFVFSALFNPLINQNLIDNEKAIVYEKEMKREGILAPQFIEDLKTHFASDPDSSWLRYQGCIKHSGVSCVRESAAFQLGYSLDYQGKAGPADVVIRFIVNTFASLPVVFGN